MRSLPGKRPELAVRPGKPTTPKMPPHGDGDSSPDPGDPRLPAENAGQSTAARGEDIMDRDGKEAGRQDTGTQGASQRPTGTSTARDVTGVNPQDPIDPESPNRG
jgi:hypothetical protein